MGVGTLLPLSSNATLGLSRHRTRSQHLSPTSRTFEMDLERGVMPTPDDLNTLLASNAEISIFR
jgi:hypothetical protein